MTATPRSSHDIASQANTIRSVASRWFSAANSGWNAAGAAVERIAIRGQLGPSVGRPNDRRPEPRF